MRCVLLPIFYNLLNLMKIPNFKLRFQTSQITVVAATIIIKKILEKLEDKKYQIRAVTDTKVAFGWDPFRWVWNFQAPYILDGGNFEITKSEKGSIVVLNYFIDTLYPLLIITAFVTFFTIQGEYFGILFFGTFFLIAGTYQYFTTKNVGKELLNSVLTEDY